MPKKMPKPRSPEDRALIEKTLGPNDPPPDKPFDEAGTSAAEVRPSETTARGADGRWLGGTFTADASRRRNDR